MSDEQGVAAVRAMYQAWAQDFGARGSDGYVAHFADDGMLMPPKSLAVVGKQAVYDWIETFGNHLTLQIKEFVQDKIEVSGNLAYCLSHATGSYTIQSTGQVVSSDLKYLDVLKKQPDGSWKIACHAWSSNNMLPMVWDKTWEELDDWE